MKIKVDYIFRASLGGNGGITPPIESLFFKNKFYFRDLGHIQVNKLYRNSQNEIVNNLRNSTKYINFAVKGYAPRVSFCHFYQLIFKIR